MRVVCDNCGASYKIPDSKLTKEVNKATCRKCGHAIFIRRAGEEEPKPAPAPPPQVGEERTLITSAADLERAVRSRASGFEETADQRPTTVSLDNAAGEATVPREPAPAPDPAFPPPAAAPFPPPSPFAPPPGAAPAPAFIGTAGFAPAPAPVAPPPAAPPPVAPRVEAPRPTPTISPADSRPAPVAPVMTPPAPYTAPAPAPVAGAHDPRTDLGIALAALFVTVLGVLVLAVANLLASGVVAGLGVFLALVGIFVTVLILITGGRGTRPASLVVSFLGGLFLSAVASASITAAFLAFPHEPETAPPVAAVTPPVVPPVAPPAADLAAVAEVTPAPATPEATPAPATPDPAATMATPAPATPVAATPAPATPAPATPAPATPTTTKASTPATSTRTTSSSSRTTSSDEPVRITPTTTKSSASTPASTKTASTPAPSTPTSSSKSTGVSAVVIDTMIKSNKGVKTCFVNQRNETGDLPRGVKVKLTIQPSGKVSSASIPSGEWAGTDFDTCLSGAVKSITFPPFDGDPVTVTYPFSI